MPKYSVKWNESHQVTVKADSEEEAVTKVQDGEYETEKETMDLVDGPDAEELNPDFDSDDKDETETDEDEEEEDEEKEEDKDANEKIL